MAASGLSHPDLRHVLAPFSVDGGYTGSKLRATLADIDEWTIQIVKRSDTAEGFDVIPRRWVVDRTFAWLNRCRRLSVTSRQVVRSFPEQFRFSAIPFLHFLHGRSGLQG